MKFRDITSRFSKLRGEQQKKRATDNASDDSEKLVFAASTKRKFPTWSQVRYLPALLSKAEVRIFWVALLVFVVGLGAFGWRRFDAATTTVAQTGGVYTEGVVGTPQYINPILAPLSDVDSDLSSLIFPSLMRRNDQLALENDLITNYVVSDDELTYTFFMRTDAIWHNSEERVDADDVMFTIQAIQDSTYQSPLKSSLEGVTAEKIDEASFSLTLEEPYAPFLSTLTFGILPEHLWFSIPGQNVRLNGLNLQPVGAGPYQFKELTKDDAGNVKSFTVERNENYYGEQPYIDEIQFLFYPDAYSAVEALKSNRVEGLSFVPSDKKTEVQDENGDVVFHSLRIPQYTAVFFNLSDNEALQDKEVRKALARAIDRDNIIGDILNGDAYPVYSPILPGYVGYDPDIRKNQFNLDKAREFLRAAEWRYPRSEEEEESETEEEAEALKRTADGEVIPRERDEVILEFTLTTVDLPEYEETAKRLAANWEEIGVKVTIETFSAEDIQTSILKGREYEALLFGQIVGADPDPYAFWHSSQQEHPGLALSIAYNEELDTIIEEARKTNDAEKREELYTQFQDIIARDLPALFIYNPLYTYAVNDKVQGIRADQYIAVPSDRFSVVDEWYIETSRQRQ